MYRPLASSVRRTPAPRRGALLIAVLGLLTLFAIFALFFVFYADNEAKSARIAREVEAVGEDGPPNDFAVAAFSATLRSVIFDETDAPTGVINPLRGHSLARSMYGWNGTSVGPAPVAPFSGLGTFHQPAPNGQDRALWINYSAPFTVPAPGSPQFPANNTYWLDPEWTDFRLTPELNTFLPGAVPNRPSAGVFQTHVPKNAPYTYPDLKDLILASLSPATGEVLVPSLHRNWLFNSGNTNATQRLAPWDPNDDPSINPATTTFRASNTDWVNPEGRTRILRPRPVDQLTPADLMGAIGSPTVPANFTGTATAAQRNALFNLINRRIASGLILPYPPFNADGTYSGDVQNLMGSVGIQKNDSILIDIGMPPRKWNGKWIKPLASILLSDLDGLLNLNAHGNMRGGASTAPNWDRGSHASYSGYGPHEVNLGAVLTNAEAVNIVQARYGVTAWAPNTRYMPNQVVVNAGNFYRVANMGVPPAGPPPGWLSAPTGPGPTGTYPPPQSIANDNQVIWEDVNIGLSRSGQGVLALSRSGTRTTVYAPVNFDAGGNAPTYTLPSLPGAGGFQTQPLIASNGTPQSFFNDVADTYAKNLNHPLLYNTHEWPSGFAGRRTFGMGDLKRFTTRYAADLDYYRQTDIARSGVANAGLIGSTGAGASYRLDASHFNRGLFTSFSNHLDRAHMAANFPTSPPIGGGFLALPVGQYHPSNPAFTGTFAASPGPDFASTVDLRNPRAALGGIDLNRPLADYRTDTNLPLGQPSTVNPGDLTNAGNSLQAWVDRHNLARDILGRLIVATGAQATVFTTQVTTMGMPPVTYYPGDILIQAGAGTPEHNAIRYLAQLAANIVDLTDSDDISTPFAWETGVAWTTPRTITQVTTADIQGMIAQATAQPGGVVFGVEKPRLVINEAYGEITNEPGENFMGPAARPARVRFWVELMNPSSAPYAVAGANEPLGNGAVAIRPGAFSAYQLQVNQITAMNQNDLINPTNVTGTLSSAGANEGFTFDFSTAAGRTVLPIGSAANPYAPPNGNPGILLVGPQPYNGGTPHPGPVEFSPDTTMAPWNGMVQGNAFGMGSTMEYALAGAPASTDLEDPMFMQKFRQHSVLLRRLANPYLAPAADNPYITVDVMNYVPAYDAVVRGGEAGVTMDRTGKGAMGTTTTAGYEDITNRYAVGKVQPYAGYSAQGGAMNNNVTEIGAFPQSMVIRQNPNPLLAGQPQHTFFRMNGRSGVAAPAIQTTLPAPPATTAQAVGLNNETIMAPFDWFVHFDRPLVNQMELLSLHATKPHEVTAYTILPPLAVGQPVRRGQGLAPWMGYNTTTNQPGFDPTTNRTNNGLYRALETLRVKPWMYGVAAGGKQHGRINLNMIQDERILQALLHANGNNTFLNTDVSLLWTGQAAGVLPAIPGFITNTPGAPVVGSRTPNSADRPVANGSTVRVPMPGPTYHDLPNSGLTLDRPFLSLGVGEFTLDAGNTVPVARIGSGLQDTIFRVNGNVGSPTFGAPLISVSSQTAPYMQAEMARKMFNNATTVSHGFAVSITIVFHEVRMNGTNMETITEVPGQPRYLIGKEAYKDIPGDLRQQFFAVVDRSSLGLQLPGTPQANQLQPQPLHAELDLPVVIGQTAPTTPPMGFINARPGSYNIYLLNATCSSGMNRYTPGVNPYTTAPGTFTDTVFVDGRQVTIQNGSFITIGIGVNQEPATLMVNWVNQDGSLNVGDTTVPLSPPVRNHVPGELVSNFQTGNPGPNPLLGFTFDPLNQNPNNPYRAVVPYAQRVR